MVQGASHPATDEYDQQLHQNDRPGQHGGPDHQTSRTAYDLKGLHRQLSDFPDGLLKQIPVLDAGTRLKEGQVYLDLARPGEGEFRGMNDMVAGPEHYYVAKNMVTDYELWNRLRGEQNPERLGRFSSQEEKDQAA